MSAKSDLRLHLRKLRQSFVLKHLNSTILLPESIAQFQDLISRAKCVAGFHDVNGEPDLAAILAVARSHGVTTALPWLPPELERVEARSAHLRFRRWSPGDALFMTPLGFYQPGEDAEVMKPDLILTPLVGFDRALNRLGQGAGHYDRAFTKHPNAIRIGIAWSVQEVDHIPTDPWDVPLDAILTEQEWITGPQSRLVW